MSRFLSTNFLLITLLLLAMIFESTSACGRRRRRHRHFGKRSVRNAVDDWFDNDFHDHEPRPTFRKPIDPLVKNQKKSVRIEKSLPYLDTSCGKVLCTNSPNYPTAAMAKVVDESRKILESGVPSIVFKNRGMSLESFYSKIIDSETNGRCYGNKKITYPLEGYNRRHGQFYYIVNIPSFRQGVCTDVCSSKNGHYQGYTEEKLVVLPIGQQNFKIQDLKIRKILVPHDCPERVF